MIDMGLEYAEQLEEPPSIDDFQRWVDLALVDDKCAQVSIRVVGEAESQSLNKEYRSKDKATNVLSFPMQLPDDVISELNAVMLGDLVICAPVVEAEAIEQHKKSLDHWAHMVIHGMLHLQGYDHISAVEADAMENLEIKLLQQIGIDNPYLETHLK